MKILALPNAFKGSLSARKVGQIIYRELSASHDVCVWPICDGGDGFLDFFKKLDPHAKTISLRAQNAFLKKVRTSFLLLSDKKTAVIETARICGLGHTPKNQLDPLGASSYGVGQVLCAAIKRGAKIIYVGLGGVACNDAGAGLAVACGAKLLDKNGPEIALGAEPLLKLHRVDLSKLKKQFSTIKIIGVSDVTNPLLGPLGSARIFGPQKGATPKQVQLLEKALCVWARIVKLHTGRNIATAKSAGAAGAIAAGLYGCFGAKLKAGAETLFKKAHVEKLIRRADWIITSEGKLDAQTFYGKAPGEVLVLARKYKKPVLFICGQKELGRFTHPALSTCQVVALTDIAREEDAKKHAPLYIKRVLKKYNLPTANPIARQHRR